ncbi:MAG: proton-conducting transporter membrane subunit, partial [Gaiellaceae bacterium]
IAADVGAIVGCLTLLIAASIALVVTDLKRVIAYSTMSQIGYMIMGVCSAAYAAGLFHLMTHAFFKALLFMAAGSVIAAMAGTQDLDKMGGFRRAMPFTFGCMVIGGLALAGIPPFSGFFSKDEILALMIERGGWHVVLAVLGYLGALLTAIYTFRMIFRAFLGEPCAEARELEGGHVFHAEQPTNPATGEVEDTDVGFPGPEHHIAERAIPMRIAMAILGFGALFAGFLQIPGVTDVVEGFLEGTFEGSRYAGIHPSDSAEYTGLVIGGALSIVGIAIAYLVYVARPGITAGLVRRYRWLHDFLERKWYFDELIDALVYRPVIRVGRFANDVVERVLVDGIVGATTGAVRELGLLVRGAQSGFIRAYALLVLGGFAALALYFLVVSN